MTSVARQLAVFEIAIFWWTICLKVFQHAFISCDECEARILPEGAQLQFLSLKRLLASIDD
jgi:hypothetical protein